MSWDLIGSKDNSDPSFGGYIQVITLMPNGLKSSSLVADNAHPTKQPSGLPDEFGPAPGPPNFSFDTITTRAIATLLQADPVPKLVTVTAPPGYGKTVLLSKLHSEFLSRGYNCLWVQLDDRDVDLASLLHKLKSALESAHLAARQEPANGAVSLTQATCRFVQYDRHPGQCCARQTGSWRL